MAPAFGFLEKHYRESPRKMLNVTPEKYTPKFKLQKIQNTIIVAKNP